MPFYRRFWGLSDDDFNFIVSTYNIPHSGHVVDAGQFVFYIGKGSTLSAPKWNQITIPKNKTHILIPISFDHINKHLKGSEDHIGLLHVTDGLATYYDGRIVAGKSVRYDVRYLRVNCQIIPYLVNELDVKITSFTAFECMTTIPIENGCPLTVLGFLNQIIQEEEIKTPTYNEQLNLMQQVVGRCLSVGRVVGAVSSKAVPP